MFEKRMNYHFSRRKRRHLPWKRRRAPCWTRDPPWKAKKRAVRHRKSQKNWSRLSEGIFIEINMFLCCVQTRRLLRRGPAHQRVLPALSGVEVHLPLLGAVDSRLHGRFGRHKDVNRARFDVLLWDSSQAGDVLNRQKNSPSETLCWGRRAAGIKKGWPIVFRVLEKEGWANMCLGPAARQVM